MLVLIIIHCMGFFTPGTRVRQGKATSPPYPETPHYAQFSLFLSSRRMFRVAFAVNTHGYVVLLIRVYHGIIVVSFLNAAKSIVSKWFF